MEIRQNPYEDLDDGGAGAHVDRTVDIGESPFEDKLGGDLTKKVGAP